MRLVLKITCESETKVSVVILRSLCVYYSKCVLFTDKIQRISKQDLLCVAVYDWECF